RAASQLRRLQREMEGTGAGSASGTDEAKLEAQQIAQEQHRIATEAGRLDRNAAAAASDARRRLAAEKDRLASRVDNLRRQLAQPSSGADGKAQQDAAGMLDRERVADRMRESAKRMRDGQAANSSQSNERELAQALDK